MGGNQDVVKTVWLDDILIAILANTVEPVSWLSRNDYVLMGDVKFDIGAIRVPVRHFPSGHTSLARITTVAVER